MQPRKLKNNTSKQKWFYPEEEITICKRPYDDPKWGCWYKHLNGQKIKVRLFWQPYEYKFYRVSEKGEYFNNIIFKILLNF